MADFHFELVSPERIVFEGEVISVEVPAKAGNITVLKGHQALLTTLKIGIVIITRANKEKARFYVRGGFADMSAKGLTILASEIMAIEEFNEAKIKAELARVQSEFQSAKTDEDKANAAEELYNLENLTKELAA